MDKIVLTIDGIQVAVPPKTTIIEAAKSVGIKIPSLCYLNMPEIDFKNDCASCRICVVKVNGKHNLVPACSTLVSQGLSIQTNNLEILNKRKNVLDLILSDHPKDCLICSKNQNCELQKLAADFGIKTIHFSGSVSKKTKEVSPAIIRDLDKCIMCRRCENMCSNVQKCNVLSGIERGFNSIVSTAYHRDLEKTKCTFCGQCVAVCPVGALYENDYTNRLIKDLSNNNKYITVQIAPAVRVAIGEEFSLPPGTNVEKKLVTALKKIGIKQVFDTNFAADLTIMEEATEFKSRIDKFLKGEPNCNLPLLTSCCPAWVNFIETNYPDMLNIPSTAKSPQQMMGAVVKHIWSGVNNIPKQDILHISIMPCLAKKYEASQEKFILDNVTDVDYSISTRELANLFKQLNIDFNSLEETEFDNPLGYSSGAGTIFGRTGGVIEAATRTLYEWMTGNNLENVNFKDMRGMDGIKVCNIKVGELNLKIGIAHGLGSAKKLLDKIKKGEEFFHAIEIMACKGGCVNGGGQPYHHGDFSKIVKRIEGLQSIDDNKAIRKSHENPYIKGLYNNYLDYPSSYKAHKILHTKYYAKK